MYRFKLILEIIDNEKLLKNAENKGKYLLKRIQNLADEFPSYLTNPRGIGLFCAFDLPSQIERDKLLTMLLDKKILILGSGDNSVRFRPHLNVKEEDINIAIDAIFKTIKVMLN